MVSKPKAKAPEHVSEQAQALWKRLHRTYRIDLPASVLLLTTLVESWDRARECREALKGQALTITDKHGGVRIHPLIVEERACREQVSRLARTLRIHTEASDV
jgi:phage terminase small subunit